MRAIGTVVLAGVTALILAQAAPTLAAITFGQIDDFEDGTLQSWGAGAANPVGPSNVATGGPAGSNDNFLRLRSNGGGPGGKLVVFNGAQWAGDYLAAGIGAIRMQVSNPGSSDLVLRLILVSGFESLATIEPVDVPSGSGWTAVSFSLASANLTGGSYDAIMSAVDQLNLVHAPSVIASRQASPPIVAQLRVDNITAVPEPATSALMALGLCALVSVVVARRSQHHPGRRRVAASLCTTCAAA